MGKASKFMKVFIVICMIITQLSPTISVFADTTTMQDVDVNVDVANDNYTITATDLVVNPEETYSIDLVAEFIYQNGEVIYANANKPYTIQNILGSELLAGYKISNFSSIVSTLGFNNWTAGYAYQEENGETIYYNGTYKFTVTIKNNKNEEISIVETTNKIESDITEKTGYTYYAYETNDGVVGNITNDQEPINLGETTEQITLYGNLYEPNDAPYTIYKVSGAGYDESRTYTNYQLFNEDGIITYNFKDKLPGTYTYNEVVTLTKEDGTSVSYPKVLKFRYGTNLDSILSNEEYTFKDGLLIIEGSYNSVIKTRKGLVDYVTNIINNSNYNVSIVNQSNLNVYDESALTTDDKLIITSLTDESYNETYNVIVKYDYDNDGQVTYSDLENIINEKLGNKEVSKQTNLGDVSQNPTKDTITNVQKKIDNVTNITEPTSPLEITTSSVSEVINGEELRVTYKLNGKTDTISGINGTLNYDKENLTLTDIIVSDTLSGAINTNTGEFQYVGNINNGDVLTLVFKAKKPVDSTNISINNLEINKYDYTYNLTNNSNLTANIKIKKSNNAYLKTLTIKEAEINFQKDVFEYNITIPTDVDKLTINYDAEIGTSLIPYNSDDNGNFKINETKTLYITVLAEDNVTEHTYKINVTKKQSNDNNINDIKTDKGNLNFDGNKQSYNVNVDANTDHLDLNIVLRNNKATYTILGNSNFKAGLNLVTIRVVAEDGTIKEYYISVNKASSGVEQGNTTTPTNNNGNQNPTQTQNIAEEVVETKTEDIQKYTNVDDKDKTSKKDKTKIKEEDAGISHIIIIILILLVIAGLIYLIFKDDEDEKKQK